VAVHCPKCANKVAQRKRYAKLKLSKLENKMNSLKPTKTIIEQSDIAQSILSTLPWAKLYESRKLGLISSDLMQCKNDDLQFAIDDFEDSNDLPNLKFSNESLDRYLKSLGLFIDRN
jgi:hypothetical protein